MMKSILNAELFELKKTSKTDLKLICTKYQKEDMQSDSHLIFDAIPHISKNDRLFVFVVVLNG